MAETEIKKINGRSIADETAREAAKNSIKYTEQTLTAEQKAQALTNIGAVAKAQSSADSGKFFSIGADGNVTPAANPVFYVTLTKSGNTTSSDKTLAEIKAAYLAKCSVFAVASGFVLPLLSISDEAAVFCAITPDSTNHRIAAMVTANGAMLVSGSFVEGNQGADNAGKILGINDSGNVVPEDKPVQALVGSAAPTAATAGVVGQEYYVIVDGAVTEMYVCTSALIGSYTWDKVEFGGGYTLPTASSTTLGGVKPIAKTDAMTQGVGVDAAGALWTAALGGAYKILVNQTLEEAAAVNIPMTEETAECNEYIIYIVSPAGENNVKYNAYTIVVESERLVNNMQIVDATYGIVHVYHIIKISTDHIWANVYSANTTTRTPEIEIIPRTPWSNQARSYRIRNTPGVLYKSNVELLKGTIIVILGR